MTREEAKRRAELYSAFAEGKIIQIKERGKWLDLCETDFSRSPDEYRIKQEPEHKYRPFNSVQEAWDEIAKHSPFGWVRFKEPYNIEDIRRAVTCISEYDGLLSFSVSCSKYLHCYPADKMFEIYEFTDGTPFGMKEE